MDIQSGGSSKPKPMPTVNDNAFTTVHEYLSVMATMWDRPYSFEKFVLQHGKQYNVAPLKDKHWLLRGKIKECFCNAALAAMWNKGLTYVEGYACGVIPVLHAWCVDKHGDVVELTWPEVGTDYYGVPFNRKFLARQLCKTKQYGLIDSHKDDFGLIRGVYKKKEWCIK